MSHNQSPRPKSPKQKKGKKIAKKNKKLTSKNLLLPLCKLQLRTSPHNPQLHPLKYSPQTSIRLLRAMNAIRDYQNRLADPVVIEVIDRVFDAAGHAVVVFGGEEDVSIIFSDCC